MKKANSLAEQIKLAQQTYNSWPDSRKSILRLEGSGMFTKRSSTEQAKTHHKEAANKKK